MNGLLIDMDGVLRLGNKPTGGCKEFLDYVHKSERKACILSNSTLADSKGFREFFTKNSIPCELPIMTTVEGTLKYVKSNYTKIDIYCDERVKNLFEEFKTEDEPEFQPLRRMDPRAGTGG